MQSHNQLLDRFWRARGIMNDALRKELVDAGLSEINREGDRRADSSVIEESGTSWVTASSGVAENSQVHT